jgi:hypothetical protein
VKRACHAQRLAIVLLMFALDVPVRAQTAPAATPPTAFVFFQRTSGHVKLSTPEVFQQVVDEVQEYLKSKRIATITSTNVPPPGILAR